MNNLFYHGCNARANPPVAIESEEEDTFPIFKDHISDSDPEGLRVEEKKKSTTSTTMMTTITTTTSTTSAAALLSKVKRSTGTHGPVAKKQRGTSGRSSYALDISDLPIAAASALEQAETFFTREINSMRVGGKLLPETWRKRREYFLCFQGFLANYYSAEEGDNALELGLHTVLDTDAAERYLSWLHTERKLDASTRRMHGVGLAVILQYITAIAKKNKTLDESYEEAANVYKQLGEQLGAEKAANTRPVTRETLQEQKKWLDWDQVLEVVSKESFAVSAAQKRHGRGKKGTASRDLARKHMVLLALRFYTDLPPGRSKEFWTLTFGKPESSLVKRNVHQPKVTLPPS